MGKIWNGSTDRCGEVCALQWASWLHIRRCCRCKNVALRSDFGTGPRHRRFFARQILQTETVPLRRRGRSLGLPPPGKSQQLDMPLQRGLTRR